MKWIAYNIRRTGDINVHTTRTGEKALHAMLFSVRAVHPYVRAVLTARTYG